MGYYITDDCGYRMRDSKDELFSEPTIDAVEDVLLYYFDVGYGDTFRVYDEDGNLVKTYHREEFLEY